MPTMPDTINFTKMHGCGNDFIVFDDPQLRFDWDQLGKLARYYCRYKFGIGADGVIAIGHPTGGDAWDYEMRYVNADGSRAEMCGNGIRCVGKYVADALGDARDEVHVLTGNGVLPVRLHRNSGGAVDSATVSMGMPGLQAGQVPTLLAGADERVIATGITVAGEPLHVTVVSMGNPHAVSFVAEPTDHHVLELGPVLEVHPAFPQRVNAEFVQVITPRRLRMRVWERGCGETAACGTGACATVVAAVLNGHVPAGQDIVVVLNGGELVVSWDGEGSAVQMTGPAVSVFRGEFEPLLALTSLV